MNTNVKQRTTEKHSYRGDLGRLAAALVLAVFTLSAHAEIVDTVWTNADVNDSSWDTAGNWDNGVPTGDADLNAVFGTDPSIGDPVIPGGSRQFQKLVFEGAGWTLDGGQIRAKEVKSSGNGVNTIGTFRFNSSTDKVEPFDVDAGNTLVISDRFEQRSVILDKTGDGMFVVSGDNKAGNRRFGVSGGTMLLNTGTQPMRHGKGGNVQVSATLGGDGSISMSHTKRLDIKSGGVLAPGGMDGFGDPFGTFTYDASFEDNPGGNLRMETGSTLRIRIGDALGENSQLVLGSVGDPSLELQSDVTLDLVSDFATPVAGEYTIATFGSGLQSGEFDNVTFNGSSSMVSGVTYADTEVSVTLVPEPTSLALLALGGVGLLTRKRSTTR